MKKLLCLLAASAIAFTASASAAGWPEKPIKLVVPFKAGGTSDQVGRVLQAAIQENKILDQPVTILNVGGHFSIGARRVKEASPDGYEFLLIHIAIMGGEGTGALNFGWRDFKPVAGLGEFCIAPMVRKDSGINSMAELLAKAKAEPDTLLFGANLGAINHLAGLMIQEANPGSKFRFVQIGGGTANYTALTGAHTNTTVLSGAEVVKFTQLPDGSDNPESQIKPLAYSGAERFAGMPDIPTLKELGYDVQFCINSWVFAPKDTSAEAVNGMADALEKATGSDRYKVFIKKKGFSDNFLKGDNLQASMQKTWDDIEPIAKLAKQK